MRRGTLLLVSAVVLATTAPSSGAAPAGTSTSTSTLRIATAASDGHPTHPVWYHDSTLDKVGRRLFVAWNTDHGSVEARSRNLVTSRWSAPAVRISTTPLERP